MGYQHIISLKETFMPNTPMRTEKKKVNMLAITMLTESQLNLIRENSRMAKWMESLLTTIKTATERPFRTIDKVSSMGPFINYKYYGGKELKVVEGQYIEGSKDGEWRYYNESGEKIITETYENGNLVKKEKEVDFEGKWNATKQMVNESGDVCSQYSYLLKINEKGLISKHTGAENYQNAGFIEQTASIFKKFTFDWSENTEYRFKKIDDNTYQLTRSHPPKPHPHLYKKNAPTSDPVITPEGNTKAPYKICETEVWTFKRAK
jgi:hypothetical protein